MYHIDLEPLIKNGYIHILRQFKLKNRSLFFNLFFANREYRSLILNLVIADSNSLDEYNLFYDQIIENILIENPKHTSFFGVAENRILFAYSLDQYFNLVNGFELFSNLRLIVSKEILLISSEVLTKLFPSWAREIPKPVIQILTSVLSEYKVNNSFVHVDIQSKINELFKNFEKLGKSSEMYDVLKNSEIKSNQLIADRLNPRIVNNPDFWIDKINFYNSFFIFFKKKKILFIETHIINESKVISIDKNKEAFIANVLNKFEIRFSSRFANLDINEARKEFKGLENLTNIKYLNQLGFEVDESFLDFLSRNQKKNELDQIISRFKYFGYRSNMDLIEILKFPKRISKFRDIAYLISESQGYDFPPTVFTQGETKFIYENPSYAFSLEMNMLNHIIKKNEYSNQTFEIFRHTEIFDKTYLLKKSKKYILIQKLNSILNLRAATLIDEEYDISPICIKNFSWPVPFGELPEEKKSRFSNKMFEIFKTEYHDYLNANGTMLKNQSFNITKIFKADIVEQIEERDDLIQLLDEGLETYFTRMGISTFFELSIEKLTKIFNYEFEEYYNYTVLNGKNIILPPNFKFFQISSKFYPIDSDKLELIKKKGLKKGDDFLLLNGYDIEDKVFEFTLEKLKYLNDSLVLYNFYEGNSKHDRKLNNIDEFSSNHLHLYNNLNFLFSILIFQFEILHFKRVYIARDFLVINDNIDEVMKLLTVSRKPSNFNIMATQVFDLMCPNAKFKFSHSDNLGNLMLSISTIKNDKIIRNLVNELCNILKMNLKNGENIAFEHIDSFRYRNLSNGNWSEQKESIFQNDILEDFDSKSEFLFYQNANYVGEQVFQLDNYEQIKTNCHFSLKIIPLSNSTLGFFPSISILSNIKKTMEVQNIPIIILGESNNISFKQSGLTENYISENLENEINNNRLSWFWKCIETHNEYLSFPRLEGKSPTL